MKISGNIVDVINKRIYPGIVDIEGKKIVSVIENKESYENYILPGLVDGHIHVESSMLAPSRFAQVVTPHGTVATVSDPHEIANVMGLAGIEFMISDAKTVPFKFFYTAPSCVPATQFETAGAVLTADDMRYILKKPEVVALGEVMNFPGVINDVPEVMEKIKVAQELNKPIDGHAPGLTGSELDKYASAGITTDHECATMAEAKEKIKRGMIIMIREGSAAKNFDNLIKLVKDGYQDGFFVTDDRHPNELRVGHLDVILARAVTAGVDPMAAIRMVTVNPVKHYKLPVGLLQAGDFADLIIVDNLKDFNVMKTIINGLVVAQDNQTEFEVKTINHNLTFNITPKLPADFAVQSEKAATVRVIKVKPNQIITDSFEAKLESNKGELKSDLNKDIIKISVCCRYGNNNIGLGFISGFNLKRGAIASSIAHDSHNIIAIGADDASLAKAVNKVSEIGGGIAVTNGENIATLDLCLAGIMSIESADMVIRKLGIINQRVKELGCLLEDPLMTLSFMALLVIPELRLSDRGLFDVKKFNLVKLITDNYENFTV